MSTYQALVCEVPLLVLPAHVNQHFYAEAIARARTGQYLLPSKITTRQLIKKTIDMLSDQELSKKMLGLRNLYGMENNPKVQLLDRLVEMTELPKARKAFG